ncbi:hypothetical protein CK203_024784 [Vitis vinifera]|uniref:Uncharacterized protein n=1 Tax=Vitis vinifera TaxID=29760 RepID=A0A438IT70_VITVI|nr:hypothetical protein CK203_024784 [Vitis vinifera]
MERRRQKQGEEEKGKEEKFRSDAMDREDSEMMDTETAASGTNQNDVVKDFLSLARQLINEGKPSQALQTCCGKGFVLEIMMITCAWVMDFTGEMDGCPNEASGLGDCGTVRGIFDRLLP